MMMIRILSKRCMHVSDDKWQSSLWRHDEQACKNVEFQNVFTKNKQYWSITCQQYWMLVIKYCEQLGHRSNPINHCSRNCSRHFIHWLVKRPRVELAQAVGYTAVEKRLSTKHLLCGCFSMLKSMLFKGQPYWAVPATWQVAMEYAPVSNC